MFGRYLQYIREMSGKYSENILEMSRTYPENVQKIMEIIFSLAGWCVPQALEDFDFCFNYILRDVSMFLDVGSFLSTCLGCSKNPKGDTRVY